MSKITFIPDVLTYHKLNKKEKVQCLTSLFIQKFTNESIFVPGKRKKTVINPTFFKLKTFFSKLKEKELEYLYEFTFDSQKKNISSMTDFFDEAKKYHSEQFRLKNTHIKDKKSEGDDYSDFLKEIGIKL